ncbi:phosphotransferase [Glaciecola sp.]|nr:phosphotransferase [Glaciecola sp.]
MLTEPLTAILCQRVGQPIVASDLRFSPLSGTHSVWECAFDVDGLTERVIVKQLHEHDGQAFSFASTFALQQRLFVIGIAAEPIYLSPHISSSTDAKPTEQGLLWVEAFVPAEIEQAQIQTRAPTLARALAQLHQAPTDTPADTSTDTPIRQLDPIKQCRALISALHASHDANDSSTACSLSQALDILIHEMQDFQYIDDTPVLCHNDLHLDHIRANDVCVDWEYAALGPRYFDVAMCIVINQLTPTAQTQLVKEYAQHTDCDVDTATQQTALYIRLALIIKQAWALLL